MAVDQRMVKVALAVAVVALLLASGYVALAAAELLYSKSSNQTISVSGTGSITLSPDQAQVSVGAITQANNAMQASAANAGIMNEVITRLRSLGIANDSISTISYQLSPLYNTKPNGSEVIVGYQVQHVFLVQVQNSNLDQLSVKVGQIIDSAAGAGANQISGVQLTLSERVLKQAYNQALQRAIQVASSQAQAMVSALGLRITGVQSVNQGGPVYPPVYLASTSAAERSTPIMPGTFTVTASVAVTYTVQ